MPVSLTKYSGFSCEYQRRHSFQTLQVFCKSSHLRLRRYRDGGVIEEPKRMDRKEASRLQACGAKPNDILVHACIRRNTSALYFTPRSLVISRHVFFLFAFAICCLLLSLIKPQSLKLAQTIAPPVPPFIPPRKHVWWRVLCWCVSRCCHVTCLSYEQSCE
jgi:hypothetical protein